jgi:cell division protein FtsQ
VSAISTSHPSSGVALPLEPVSLSPSARGGAARWVVLSVGIAVVLGAAWWVTNSPVFDLRSLQVRGNVHVSRATVARLSELGSQTNVLWFQAGPVQRRLEANPWVLRADVSRGLPSTVTITIEERVPVAMTAGRHPLLLASDGMVLGPAPSDTELPSVVGPKGLAVGQRLPASDALAVARSLPTEILPLVASVGRNAEGSLVATLREGIQVLYGDATQVAAKSSSLRAVLSWASRNGVHPAAVDVRAPTAPALRERSSNGAMDPAGTSASGG